VPGSPFAGRRGWMTLDQIREAYHAQPFVPFVLHLADGRGIPVRSREFMAAAPSARTIRVYRPEGRANVIDLLLVTDLEFESATHGASPR
jgi:hypothetical protein